MLELRHIHHAYGDFRLDDISLSVGDGDYFVILGPSGAGKTVLLEMMAGLVIPDRGQVFDDEMDITFERIQRRRMGLVFQDYAVFPHMSVRDNIAYPLRFSSKAYARETVQKMAERMDIAHLLHRRPPTLSGGELQRVALARTLARDPKYLLLDEPLSSLDTTLRQGLRSLLKSLNREGQTVVHVTHDYEEALVLATQVAVFDRGRIIQAGPAEEVFHHPASEFVARFTGIRNYFPARLFHEDDRQYAELENGQVLRLATREQEGRGVVLVGGEDIVLSLENLPSSAANRFPGIINEITPYPLGFEVMVDAGTQYYVRVTRESLHSLGLRTGLKVWLSFKASSVRFVRV